MGEEVPRNSTQQVFQGTMEEGIREVRTLMVRTEWAGMDIEKIESFPKGIDRKSLVAALLDEIESEFGPVEEYEVVVKETLDD